MRVSTTHRHQINRRLRPRFVLKIWS